MRSLRYAALLYFLSSVTAHAATIFPPTCGGSDVAAAVNSANDGDTIVIPPGTCTWTTNLLIGDPFNLATNPPKILSLQGAGIDVTTIVDGTSHLGYPNTPGVLSWTTKDNGVLTTRVTGITFQGGTNPDCCNYGMIHFYGTSHLFRIDHCKFVPTQTAALFLYDDLFGVVDHNTFDVSAGNSAFGMYVFHNSWNVPGSDFGDASWADSSSLGTASALFVEDNLFTNNQSVTQQQYANDGWSGGRVVYRHNTYTNTTWANHGTESSGRYRSQRQFEVYNNTFSLNGLSFEDFLDIRGGTGVVFNNTATLTNGGAIDAFAVVKYLRSAQPFDPWGQCTGTNVWDQNSNPTGYLCLDQPGAGKGNLLTSTPGQSDALPVGWPHEMAEPVYGWNNTINGVPVAKTLASAVTTVVLEGRDFFNYAKPAYIPYTYPHPLVSPAQAPPPAPQNLRIVK